MRGMGPAAGARQRMLTACSPVQVYDVKCFYCDTKLRAPWVGEGIVKCGVCMKLLQIKRPGDAACSNGACNHHGHSKRSTGLGGYDDPSQCICEKIFFWCPSAASFYFAIFLTTFIIGEGFIRVAPQLFPAPDTPVGALLWGLSVYISMNTVANFYWGATTDPGKPPISENDIAAPGSDGSGATAKSGETAKDQEAESLWCDICEAAKPPDTHHCRRCKRCVYGMDHHCVFLNTCVGAGNHRYFLLFLFWVSLATLYVAACTFIVVRRILLEKRIDRLDILETMRVEGKLPDMRLLLMSSQGIGGFIATVALPIITLYGDTAGWETVVLFIVSGTTFVSGPRRPGLVPDHASLFCTSPFCASLSPSVRAWPIALACIFSQTLTFSLLQCTTLTVPVFCSFSGPEVTVPHCHLLTPCGLCAQILVCLMLMYHLHLAYR